MKLTPQSSAHPELLREVPIEHADQVIAIVVLRKDLMTKDEYEARLRSLFADEFLKSDKIDYGLILEYIQHYCRTPLINIQLIIELMMTDPESKSSSEDQEKFKDVVRNVNQISSVLSRLTELRSSARSAHK